MFLTFMKLKFTGETLLVLANLAITLWGGWGGGEQRATKTRLGRTKNLVQQRFVSELSRETTSGGIDGVSAPGATLSFHVDRATGDFSSSG